MRFASAPPHSIQAKPGGLREGKNKEGDSCSWSGEDSMMARRWDGWPEKATMRHVLVRPNCVPFVHKYQLARGRAVRQRLVMCHTCTVLYSRHHQKFTLSVGLTESTAFAGKSSLLISFLYTIQIKAFLQSLPAPSTDYSFFYPSTSGTSFLLTTPAL